MTLYESLQLTKIMSPEDKIKYSDAMYVYLNFDRWGKRTVLKHMSLSIAKQRLTDLENKYSINHKQLLENMRVINEKS